MYKMPSIWMHYCENNDALIYFTKYSVFTDLVLI